jgi:hypothetical protein
MIKRTTYAQLKVKKVVELMLDDCVAEYIRIHPHMKETYISRNKIVYEIAKFYLNV